MSSPAEEEDGGYSYPAYSSKSQEELVTKPQTEVGAAFQRVRGDATHASVFFHTWWALAGVAKPEYTATMNNQAYVDFFHACEAGFLTLVFVSLGRLLDSDSRSLGLKHLHEVLQEHGHANQAAKIEKLLSGNRDLARRIRGIRNKSAAHTDREMTREDVYGTYGVTPDELRKLARTIVDVMNDVEQSLGLLGLLISTGERQQRATISLLRCLRDGPADDPS